MLAPVRPIARLTAVAIVAAVAVGCGSTADEGDGAAASAARVALCEDLPRATASVIGDGSPDGPGMVFIGVVLTYFAEHPDIQAGGWIDHDAGGTYVVAVKDDPEIHRAALAARAPSPNDVHAVEPPPEITDTRPIGEWDVAWDIVRVERSAEDIIEDSAGVWQALETAGIDIVAAGEDLRRGRFTITLTEPTEAKLGEIAELTDPLLVCVEGPLVDPNRPKPNTGDELAVIPPDGMPNATTLVSCSGRPPFPLARILEPQPVSDRQDIMAALQNQLASAPTVPGSGSSSDWIIVAADDDTAALLSPGGLLIDMRSTQIGWTFAGSGGCGLRTALPAGVGAIDWRLDPDRPVPTADSTEINVLISEAACASGQPLGDRLLGPQVVETSTEVLIAFAAISLPGAQNCPANPERAESVTLGAPLGTRALRDGVALDLDLAALLAG